MARIGSAINKIFSDLTKTLNSSKNEVNDVQSDLKEEKDEVNHLEKAESIIEPLRGSTDKFQPSDLRRRLKDAEAHLDKAREEEEDLLERHKEEVKISQNVDTDLTHLEKEIEKIRHEM